MNDNVNFGRNYQFSSYLWYIFYNCLCLHRLNYDFNLINQITATLQINSFSENMFHNNSNKSNYKIPESSSLIFDEFDVIKWETSAIYTCGHGSYINLLVDLPPCGCINCALSPGKWFTAGSHKHRNLCTYSAPRVYWAKHDR